MSIPNIRLMREILSSAPVRYMQIPAILIRMHDKPPIGLCTAYRDYELEIDNELINFIGAQINYQLPKIDTSGSQTLAFGVAGASREIAQNIRAALKTGEPVTVEFLIFIEDGDDNTHQLGYRLRKMEILTANIDGDVATFEAQYNGMLTTRYPREFYTSESAPGIIYIS